MNDVPPPRRKNGKRVMQGALLALVLALFHAAGWGVAFALGPTPRDFTSSHAFGLRVFTLLAVAGTVLGVPWGALCGVLRARHPHMAPRVLTAVAAAPLGLLAAAVAIASGGREVAVTLPAVALAALGGYALARWP